MSNGVKIKAVQGDTLGPVLFRFKDGAGNAFDLTGSTLSIRIKTTDTPIEVTSTDLNDGLVIDDPASGECALTLSAAETARLLVGTNSVFRFRRTIAGNTTTLVYGVFYVEAGGP